jgi:hypothetical protein
MDGPPRAEEQGATMTSTAPTHTAFAYIDCDVPAGQTLLGWQRDVLAARRAARRPRFLRLPRRPRPRPAASAS